ncbi:MAG: pyridoxamine 5'-phosphate oxidase family protein [Tissierellia bacterium]|nr:pyridoxamine 5'-phosphate oxidase family protein [Tissierellia bacterium]
MFKPIRKRKQEISKEKCIEILERGTAGVFALCGEEYPYALPMSYIYYDDKIYFHCAKQGHKIDLLKKHPKLSFCVIDADTIVPQEFTTYYRSVIVFGEARLLEDKEEIIKTITLLSDRFSPLETQRRDEVIQREMNNLQMVEVRIDHMSGKEAVELVNQG